MRPVINHHTYGAAHPALRCRALLATALLALLAACGAPTTAMPQPATVPTTAAATATHANAAPATPAATGEVSSWMTGTITRIEPSGNLGRILVEEHPDDPYGGDKAFATVTPGTPILERTAEDTAPRAFGDLQVGKRVTVTFLGPIAASYPGHGTAGEVTILRTRTDGPTPDPHAGTVTQTFRLSLFPGGDGVPPGDAFSVSYTYSGGGNGERLFCGDDPRAPQPCTGRGKTYEVRVEVPRGAELTYAVERIPATGAADAEIVERGREILDADMVATSHYRHGAPNPVGFSDAKPRATATRAGGTATPTPAIAFPQLTPVVGERVKLTAGPFAGILTLVDGCLRVAVPRSDSYLIIWPPEVTLRTDGGDVRVVDATGQVVARVGEPVALSGGVLNTIGKEGLREAPPDSCPGPYLITGDILKQDRATATPPDTTTTTPAVAFPQLAPVVGPRAMMAALLEGTLTLVDGCLRVTRPRGDSDLIIWPPEVALRTDSGDIRIVDAGGRVVVRVGEQVRMGGGQIQTIEGVPKHLLREAPPAHCPGPYWFTGEIEASRPAATPRAGTATRPPAAAPPPTDGLDTDAREYANTFGVDLQEAKRRLRLQGPIGKLGAALAAGEGDTFAGLWVEHRPAYRIVVQFTRDGERTIRPYIAGGPLADLIEVRAARWTLAELEAALAETGRLVRTVAVLATVRLNLQENRVEVHVIDRARFDTALRDAGGQLPAGVVVLTVATPAR